MQRLQRRLPEVTTHCRCRKCGHRQANRRHPDTYRRLRCKHCGAINSQRVDKWANSRPWRKNTCTCDGYHHPHRQGFGRCKYPKDWVPTFTPSTPDDRFPF